jgi:uncharacterized membrane protein YheB (UPF0754 family)
MKLQDLMQFEEKLLLCEYHNKFNMPFSDYVIMDKFLCEVENITNLYFQLMDEYKKSINKENINNDEIIEKLQNYNDKLLNEEIEFNFEPYNEFIIKYIDKN